MNNETQNNGASNMDKTVYILPALICVLLRKVNKLNKRAAKLNLTPVVCNVNPDSKITICKPNGNTIRKIRVDIEGAPVILSGWEYLGSITVLSNGEVMLSHNAPVEYIKTPYNCDHCKTNRRRKVTVALRKIDTGETVQVGRSCLADYLDNSDAVKMADWLAKVNAIADEESERDSYDGSGRGPSPEPETVTWLTMVAAVIREDGCYRNEGGTKGTAYKNYYRLPLSKNETPVVPIDKDIEAAQEGLDWARNIDAEYGYLRNVKASLMGVTIDHKALGFATSVFPAMKRARETEAERVAKEAAKEAYKARNAGSQHFGEIKNRTLFELTVMACRHYETDYGYKTAVSMIDPDGNLAVWFASGTHNYKLGEVFKVKATPKKHGTDQDGNAQTILNRCAFPADAEADE